MRDFNLIDTLDGPELTFGEAGQQIYLVDPITATFSRAGVAYKQDGTQVASGIPRFEAGRTGKALMIEEGTDNLLSGAGAVSLDATSCIYALGTKTNLGNGRWRLANPSGSISVFRLLCRSGTLINGESYAIAINADNNTGALCWIDWCDVPVTPTYIAPGRTVWISSRATYDATYRYVDINIPSGGSIDLWDAQVEHKPYATSFSPTQRGAESCSLSTAERLSADEGTIELWIKPRLRVNANNSGLDRYIIGPWSGGLTSLYLQMNANGSLGFSAGSTVSAPAGTVTDDEWHCLHLAWSDAGRLLCVNGEVVGSTTADTPFALQPIMYVGDNVDSGLWSINGLIADLRISPKAINPAEAADAYSRYTGLTAARQTLFTFNNTLVSEANPFPIPWSETAPAGHWETVKSTVITDRTDGSLLHNIRLSLAIKRGSWWFNPDFGLRSIDRLKNTDKTARLVREYVLEALQWLLDSGRATSIDVVMSRDSAMVSARLLASITVIQADGRTVQFSKYIEVV